MNKAISLQETFEAFITFLEWKETNFVDVSGDYGGVQFHAVFQLMILNLILLFTIHITKYY